MPNNSQPSQNFVPVKEIRDGVVILNDNSMHMILITSSVNFALKSDDEQAALLVQFQGFLNSLEYSTQILIQSRRLDIRPYITLLRGRLKEQLSDLMRIQTQEYMEFIQSFTKNENIMTKSFFVVVSFSPSKKLSQIKKGGIMSTLKNIVGKKDASKTESTTNIAIFEEAKSQLEQRVNVVKQGLSRTGIRAVPLGTEEVTELFYRTLNPSYSEEQLKKQ